MWELQGDESDWTIVLSHTDSKNQIVQLRFAPECAAVVIGGEFDGGIVAKYR